MIDAQYIGVVETDVVISTDPAITLFRLGYDVVSTGMSAEQILAQRHLYYRLLSRRRSLQLSDPTHDSRESLTTSTEFGRIQATYREASVPVFENM